MSLAAAVGWEPRTTTAEAAVDEASALEWSRKDFFFFSKMGIEGPRKQRFFSILLGK
jgi:hypothetical protein